MTRGTVTYRKRDLRTAREVAHDGDVVEVKRDGTICIIPAPSKPAHVMVAPPADKKKKAS
jgi:hypothetical protein